MRQLTQERRSTNAQNVKIVIPLPDRGVVVKKEVQDQTQENKSQAHPHLVRNLTVQRILMPFRLQLETSCLC
ncbi:hypothetical protein UPYG_G00053360 [Umbra pygmaea]|uniref:Uncharacterized protein n=1 Tax=Umbra pygmaea TaxID=75934 RepID=A0ABD0X8E0_UMBPY